MADDITQWQSTRLKVQFLAPQYIKRKQTETRNHESDKCTVLDENEIVKFIIVTCLYSEVTLNMKLK